MKKKILILLSILILSTFCLTGCASVDRMFKDVNSELSGGLEREVNIYTLDGTKIRTIKGKIDIEQDSTKVKFDIDGKRYIYYNCMVEVMEVGD